MHSIACIVMMIIIIVYIYRRETRAYKHIVNIYSNILYKHIIMIIYNQTANKQHTMLQYYYYSPLLLFYHCLALQEDPLPVYRYMHNISK